ncbi:MAG: cytochrome c biogenesis protein CcsA [Longimicrobiales bacterium]|nr:cytochrome c biogenesis protein CcsA [Longimicrobiales bacterium]
MIHFLALLLYIGAFVFWSRALWRGPRGSETGVAFALSAAGVAVHALALVQYTLDSGELPLAGLAPSLSTLALIIGLGLMGTLVLGEASRVGIVLVPLIVLLEGTAAFMGVTPRAGPPLDFQGVWFSLHVTLAFAGYGGMAVAFAGGLLYLIQFHELKDKHLGRLFRFLPPLTTLDRLVKTGITVGIISLGLALILGWAWTVRFRGTFQVWDPKVAWGVFSWGMLVTAMGFRLGAGRKERRGALAAVVAFGIVVLAYVVLRTTGVHEGFFL